MRMVARIVVPLAALTLLLGPTAALARDLRFGARVDTRYDSNLFSESQHEQDDSSLRLSPWIEVQDQGARLDWDLRYQPGWEGYLSHGNINGWDHDVDGNATWRVGPRTTFVVSDHFRRFRSLALFNQSVDIGGGATALETVEERSPFSNNIAHAELRYMVSPRTTATLFGDHVLWDFTQKGQRDRQTYDVGLRLTRALSPRFTAGSSVTWTRQHFEPIGLQAGTSTRFLNFSPILIFQFDDATDLRLSAGPTVTFADNPAAPPSSAQVAQFPVAGNPSRPVDVTTCPVEAGVPILDSACQNTGPPFPPPLPPVTVLFVGSVPAFNRTSLTAFADASFTRRWDTGRFELSYRRSEDRSSGFGASSISNQVVARLGWRPLPKLTTHLVGSWVRRVQDQAFFATRIGLKACSAAPATCVPPADPNTGEATSLRSVKLNQAFESTTWRLSLSARYHFDRQLSARFLANWNRVQDSGEVFNRGNVNRLSVALGFEYEFDRIRF